MNAAADEFVHAIYTETVDADNAIPEDVSGKESEDTTLDPLRVISSVNAIEERVACIATQEGVAVSTKTTSGWDNLRYLACNQNKEDKEGPLKSYELIMLREPSSSSGFVSLEEKRHPLSRIVGLGVKSVPLDGVKVTTHGISESGSFKAHSLSLDKLLDRMGAKRVRPTALVRVEAALVPDKGMKNRYLEFSQKTREGRYRVLLAHSRGIESLGVVSERTEGTLQVGLTNRVLGSQCAMSTTNDNPLKIWGQCDICGETSTLGPQTLPFEVLERGAAVEGFTCRHYCMSGGEPAQLLLRRKGARTLETMLLIYVPVLPDDEPHSPDAAPTGASPLQASPPFKKCLHPGKELNAPSDRDPTTIHVDPSRRVLINATVLFGVTDAIVSHHDVPMPLHPSDGDIRAALWMIKSMNEDLKNGAAKLHPGLLPKKVIRVHELEEDDDGRPLGKRRRLA